MKEYPKRQRPDLRERVYALLKFPACAMNEILTRIGLLDGEEREYRAQHEAGHALVFFLEGKQIQRAEINRLRGRTCRLLNQVLGQYLFLAGVVEVDEIEAQEFEEQHPDRNVIASMAGLAVTQDLKYNRFLNQIVSEGLRKGDDETWEDIALPSVYLDDRFTVIHGRRPTSEEIATVFHALLKELRLVFSEDRFRIALTKVKELIENDMLKDTINDTILNTLYSEGFSPENLAEMQRRIATIDIDRIVRNHGGVAV